MTVRAIFFDLGGVILRTEYQAPRQHLADRLKMEYEDLVRLVFDSETSRQASIGAVTTEQHWAALMKRLRLPDSDAKAIRKEFFDGDMLDRELIQLIRTLRGKYKTGLISNAWDDLHEYIVREKFDDAFDGITISAEVGAMKPNEKIYLHALAQLQVRAGEALFIDDFAVNIEGCEKVGMKGILFQDPDEVKAKLKALL